MQACLILLEKRSEYHLHRLKRSIFYLVAAALTVLDGPFGCITGFVQRLFEYVITYQAQPWYLILIQ